MRTIPVAAAAPRRHRAPLAAEQAVLREQCPKCGFHFPYMTETPSSFAVFKDIAPAAEPAGNSHQAVGVT